MKKIEKPLGLQAVHTSKLDINSWSDVLDLTKFSHDFKIWEVAPFADAQIDNDKKYHINNELLTTIDEDDDVLSVVNVPKSLKTYVLTRAKSQVKIKSEKLAKQFAINLVTTKYADSQHVLGRLLFNALGTLSRDYLVNFQLARGQLYDLVLEKRLSRSDKKSLKVNKQKSKRAAFRVQLFDDIDLRVNKTSFKPLANGFLAGLYPEEDEDGNEIESSLEDRMNTLAAKYKHSSHSGFSWSTGLPNAYYKITGDRLKSTPLYQAVNLDQNTNKSCLYQLENDGYKYEKTSFGLGWTIDAELNTVGEYALVLEVFNKTWQDYLTGKVSYRTEDTWLHIDDTAKAGNNAKKPGSLSMLMTGDGVDLNKIQVVDTLGLADDEVMKVIDKLKSLSGVDVQLVDNVDVNLPVIFLTTDQDDDSVSDSYVQAGMNWLLTQHVTKSNIEDLNVLNNVLRETKFRWMLFNHKLSNKLYAPLDDQPRALVSAFYDNQRDLHWLAMYLDKYDCQFAVLDDDDLSLTNIHDLNGNQFDFVKNDWIAPVQSQLQTISNNDTQKKDWKRRVVTSLIYQTSDLVKEEWQIRVTDWRVLGGQDWPTMLGLYQRNWEFDQFMHVVRGLNQLENFVWLDDFAQDASTGFDKHPRIGDFMKVVKDYGREVDDDGKPMPQDKLKKYSFQRHRNQISKLNDLASQVLDQPVALNGQRGNDWPKKLMLPLCGVTYQYDDNHLHYLAGTSSHAIKDKVDKLPRVYAVTGTNTDLIVKNLWQLGGNIYVRYNMPTVNFLFVKLMNLAQSIVTKRLEVKKKNDK